MEVRHNSLETLVYHPQGIGMFKRGSCIVKGQIDKYSAVGKAIVKYFHESYYRGECKDNAYEGLGTLISAKLPHQLSYLVPLKLPLDLPNIHKGTFQQGLKEGFGITSWEGGFLQTTWANGMPSGYTKAENEGDCFEGLVQNQSAVGKFANSQGKYHGQFKRGLRSGIGIWKSSANYYIGEWKEGCPDGCGEEVREDGLKLEGERKKGELDGVGRISAPAFNQPSTLSSTYIGEFKNGDKEGFGRLEENNSVYEGFWRQGEKHGLGYYTTQGGNTYFGEWEHDCRDGIGYSYSPSFRYIGEWSKDKPHGVGFITFEGKKEVLVAIKTGVVTEQLSDELVTSYRNKFKALKFEEFKLQTRERLESFQRDIDVPLDKIKRVFKNINLDFTQEKEISENCIEKLDASILSLDNAIQDIEAFLDKRCASSNVQPLQISSNIYDEDTIVVEKFDSEPFKPSKSLSPLLLRKESSPSPQKATPPKPWVPSGSKTMNPKQFSKLDDFSKHFSKQAVPKKRNEEIIDKLSGELPRKSKSELENIKEKLRKQINKVEIKESEVAKESIHVRRKENILKEMEEDLLRRERELETRSKQLTLEKMELEEKKISMSTVVLSKRPADEPGENQDETIQGYEVIHRQKEMLKQLEGMVKLENEKLLSVKSQLKETSHKLSNKKEEDILSKAKKGFIPKTTQTDPIVLTSGDEVPITDVNPSEPKPDRKNSNDICSRQAPQKQEMETQTTQEENRIEMIMATLQPFVVSPSPKMLPNRKNSSMRIEVIKEDSEKEDDQEEYFNNLHRKTNLRASTLLDTFEIPDTKEDPAVYKARIDELEEQKEKLTTEVASLQNELQTTKEELKGTKEKMEFSNTNAIKIPTTENPEISKLRSELEQKTKFLTNVSDELSKTKTELSDLKKGLDTEKSLHTKTKEEVETLRKNLDSEKSLHIKTKEELENLKKSLESEKSQHHKTKDELDALKNVPAKNTNYVSVANSAISDKKPETKPEAKETVSLSPFQSNNALTKKEEESKLQAESLNAIEDALKTLEMKNDYLEDQLAKTRAKEQKLSRLVLDYTKGLTDWLTVLQNPETATASTPETLTQILAENDQILLESLSKCDPAKTATKPPSSRFE